MTSVGLRPPGTLARQAATLQEVSGGRFELGLGLGWNEEEHLGHGLAFPSYATRLGMLAEQLAVVKGLWSGDAAWNYRGRYYTVVESATRPGPSVAPRIVIGGHSNSLMRLAAAHADEINFVGLAPAVAAAKLRAFDEAATASLAEGGRKPTRSITIPTLVTPSSGELRRHLHSVGLDDDSAAPWLEAARARGAIGGLDVLEAAIHRYQAIGFDRVILQLLTKDVLPVITFIGSRMQGGHSLSSRDPRPGSTKS